MREETYPFVMRPLPYEYYALAPILSAETLMYHHDKHYKTYVDNLNQVLADYPLLQKKSLRELLSGIEDLPDAIQIPVKNNGGGAYNHALYFDCMQHPAHQDPRGDLLEAIIRDYGSLKDFKDRLKQAAVSRFGSGYAWVVADREGKLKIMTTANQNPPDLKYLEPILVIDVWEHAYYLKYQNRRAEYVDGWMELINWGKVMQRYQDWLGNLEGLHESCNVDRTLEGRMLGQEDYNLDMGNLPQGCTSPDSTFDNAAKQGSEYSQAAMEATPSGSPNNS